MRLLVVHPRMSIMGGGERVAIHSLLAAQKAGYEVTLLSEEFDVQRVEDFFGCDGLFERVHRLTYPEFKPYFKSRFLLYQRLYYHQKQMRRVLSNEKRFDIVLGTQDVGYVPKVPAPVIQYCYFPEYFSHLETAPSSLLWKAYYWPARRFYRNRARLINRLLSTSEYTRGFIEQLWHRESTTIYPPCPVEFYSSIRGQREDLAITVGRIVPSKRMDLFLEMARRLPMFRFMIIGSVNSEQDPYYNFLNKNASNNVSIILSPLRKVKDILGRAKVYVHCMENEHFGITIVEAMASGCVPVVHDSGGPREIVTEGVGYRWRDTSQAAEEISRLMEDDISREQLSVAACKRSEIFSTEVFESSLIRILATYKS